MMEDKKQEPVAYINIEKRRLEWAYDYMSWDTPTVVNLPRIPLYITPQQRTWVQLTDEELSILGEKFTHPDEGIDEVDFGMEIQRILKEKNT